MYFVSLFFASEIALSIELVQSPGSVFDQVQTLRGCYMYLDASTRNIPYVTSACIRETQQQKIPLAFSRKLFSKILQSVHDDNLH